MNKISIRKNIFRINLRFVKLLYFEQKYRFEGFLDYDIPIYLISEPESSRSFYKFEIVGSNLPYLIYKLVDSGDDKEYSAFKFICFENKLAEGEGL